MKIAVAYDKGLVSQHFGHCEGFMVYNTENNEIISEELVKNPGHKPGFLPNFLHEIDIKVIISGGMGQGAVDIFAKKDIEVILGVEGDSKEAVLKYLQGNLKSSNSVCHRHEHKDECGRH